MLLSRALLKQMFLSRPALLCSRAWLLVLITSAGLFSCGFHLKGTQDLASFSGQSITVQSGVALINVKQRLQQRLKQHGANVTTLVEADHRLVLEQGEVNKRVLLRDSSGRASEYVLIYTITATLYSQADDKAAMLAEAKSSVDPSASANTQSSSSSSKLFSVSEQRSFRFDQQQLMASHHQEQQLLSDMQTTVVEKLSRQLSAYLNRTQGNRRAN